MSKIAIITDTHFGARGDSTVFLDYFERFYDEIFFPEIESQGIKTIIHCGDLVDRRKYINFNTANRLRKTFIEKLGNYETIILAGNHDTYHKNTSEINALHEMVNNHGNIKTIINPCVMKVHDREMVFLPWINDNNAEDSLELIENVSLDYCFGHLELQGFEMQVGSFSEHGMDHNIFNKFSSVFTGHFHHKSSKNNIHYLGAPYEMTWSDYSDLRGFHTFEVSTGDLKFIQNPLNMFHKIIYDDSNKTHDQIMSHEFSKYNKKYVKVIVHKKNNPYWFDKFIEELERNSPYNIQIIEDHLTFKMENDEEFIENAQDTFSILRNYVKTLPEGINKPKLEILLKTLYDEASLLET
jgi:DNA repair exonuclease SbcCD nuclease subunit